MRPTSTFSPCACSMCCCARGASRAPPGDHGVFDPKRSNRTFQFCVVDAGVIKLLPPLLKRVADEAPHVRLRVVQHEGALLVSWLVFGLVVFVLGLFFV